MSSPPSPGAPVPPSPIEPGRGPGGCVRGGLIGCGGAALLVLVVLALFLAYVRRKPETVTDLMMGQIERNLAADVSGEEKERLKSAYAGFRAKVKERRASREPVERMRAILSGATRGPIGREQVRDLTAALEAGSDAGPAAVPTLVPSPAP